MKRDENGDRLSAMISSGGYHCGRLLLRAAAGGEVVTLRRTLRTVAACGLLRLLSMDTGRRADQKCQQKDEGGEAVQRFLHYCMLDA